MDALYEMGGAFPTDALRETGVTVREAGPGDDAAGVMPRWWRCRRRPTRSPR